MILQHRDDTIRCILQHDHALLSGELALAWRPGLTQEMVLTIALHDLAWQPHNALSSDTPFDPSRGLIHDFITLPSDHKLAIYEPGHDLYESIHPYMGLILSLHYSAFFPRKPAYEAYLAHEAARRTRLRERLTPPGAQDAFETQLQLDFDLLKFLDVVSLYACLFPPGARADHGPGWLRPEYRYDGQEYVMRFEEEGLLRMQGWPGEDVRFVMPYRDIERRVYASAEAFAQAFYEAPLEHWVLEVKA